MNINVLSSSAVCAFLLVGCGGSSSTPSSDPVSESDSDTEATVLTGVFVDSPVEGATFFTETQSGMTNALGEFSYLATEQVAFSFGVTQFPAVTAAPQVSPVDMAASSSDPTATTTNIARLLQSLDEDGNPDNGITIPESAAAVSDNINFDVSTEEFENNPAVINLVANSGSVTTALISAEDANAHLASTLGNGGSSNVVAEGQIVTLEQFTATVGGTSSILLNDDGSRDPSTWLVTSVEDMKITGTFRGEDTNLDWFWEDEFYCRSGQSGVVTVELDCQVVTINDAVVTYTSNRGAGGSNSYVLDVVGGSPENLTPELAATGYVPELGQGSVNGITCDTDNHVGTPGTFGEVRDNIMRSALTSGNYAYGIQRLDGLGGESEGISVYRAYLDTQDIQATANSAGVTVETVSSRLACAGFRQQ